MTSTGVPLATAGRRSDPRGGRHVGWLFVGMVAAAVVVAVGVLAAAGELAGGPAGLLDPGPLVRVGLPVARAVHDVAASLTIGLLVLAVWAVAPERGASLARLTGARWAMLRTASAAAGAWLVSAVVVLGLTGADVVGVPVTSAAFTGSLGVFAGYTDLGRSLSASVLLAAVVAGLTAWSSRLAAAGWAAALGLVALLPLALTGHASGSANHENSVTSLALHLLGVAVWVGGLGALLLSARRLGPQLPTVVRRYSTLAGWCFAVVAVSGLVNAALRLEPLSGAQLGSLYGLLALGKVIGLGVLGLAGWRHRVAVLPRLEGVGGGRAFLRLAGVELVVMGATMGLAVALSRSAPPAAAGHAAVAHGSAELLGYTPPPLTPATYLSQVYPDLMWLLLVGAGLAWYLLSVATPGRLAGRWPVHRTLCWVAGCLALTAVTSGGPAVYARLTFSAHMVQHLTLMLAVPLLLVLGAPLTLARRTLRPRADGSVGLRETLELVLRSPALGYLRDPVAAAGLLVGGFVIFYYATGAFQAALFTHTGHVLMTVYFLTAGSLFMWVLVGADSARTDAAPAAPAQLRLLTLGVTSVILAVFGITLQQSGTVLARRWWFALGLEDQAPLLRDQHLGGIIATVSGVLLFLVAGLVLALQARAPQISVGDHRRNASAATDSVRVAP